jgi:hypothetical protein
MPWDKDYTGTVGALRRDALRRDTHVLLRIPKRSDSGYQILNGCLFCLIGDKSKETHDNLSCLRRLILHPVELVESTVWVGLKTEKSYGIDRVSSWHTADQQSLSVTNIHIKQGYGYPFGTVIKSGEGGENMVHATVPMLSRALLCEGHVPAPQRAWQSIRDHLNLQLTVAADR